MASKMAKINKLILFDAGLRDESGNASIIQNAVVEKKFIPSRLVMPKSYRK